MLGAHAVGQAVLVGREQVDVASVEGVFLDCVDRDVDATAEGMVEDCLRTDRDVSVADFLGGTELVVDLARGRRKGLALATALEALSVVHT